MFWQVETDRRDQRLLSTATPDGQFQLVLLHEKGHRYSVEHRDGQLYILTNKDPVIKSLDVFQDGLDAVAVADHAIM